MKRLGLILSLLCLTTLSLSALAETDQEVAARQTALDLAGAFSNDGFKLRDGHWSGSFAPHETKLFAVNLYAGNQYWFSVGASGKVKNIKVELFDESGKPVSSDPFEDEEMAAAGFSPTVSGQYFVSIGSGDGESSAFCLVYSYK